VLWITTASPVAHLDHHILTAHMVMHLLIMTVAAPLILFGTRRILVRWRPRITACWLVGTLTVLLWHVPAVFELTLESHFWHESELASFFVAGIVFWWPVIQSHSSSRWSVPVYLFLATLPCDALSAFLVFCGHVVYRPYLVGNDDRGMFGLSPLDDQAMAGALMWVTVTFAYLIPALVLTARLLASERTRPSEVGVG
jgi:cytochrome c oxidase assembly factor CtaG